MDRPAHIPPEIWAMAKQSGTRNGSYEQTVRTAEMLMRRLADEPEDQEIKHRFTMWLNRIVIPNFKGE